VKEKITFGHHNRDGYCCDEGGLAVFYYTPYTGFVFNGRRVSFRHIYQSFEFISALSLRYVGKTMWVNVCGNCWGFAGTYNIGGRRFRNAISGVKKAHVDTVGDGPQLINVTVAAKNVIGNMASGKVDLIEKICKKIGDDYRVYACMANIQYAIDTDGLYIGHRHWELGYWQYVKLKDAITSTYSGNTWVESTMHVLKHVISALPELNNSELLRIAVATQINMSEVVSWSALPRTNQVKVYEAVQRCVDKYAGRVTISNVKTLCDDISAEVTMVIPTFIIGNDAPQGVMAASIIDAITSILVDRISFAATEFIHTYPWVGNVTPVTS